MNPSISRCIKGSCVISCVFSPWVEERRVLKAVVLYGTVQSHLIWCQKIERIIFSLPLGGKIKSVIDWVTREQ